MPSPVLESFDFTGTGGATDNALAMDMGVVTAGELLLCIVGSDDNGAGDEFSEGSGDWGKIDEGGGAAADAHVAMFWKIAGVGPDTLTVDAASSDEMMGWMLHISGIDSSAPIDFFTSADDTASQTFQPLAAVPVTVDTLGINAIMFDGGDGHSFTLSVVNGWTLEETNQSGSTQNDVSGAFSTQAFSTAGSKAQNTYDASGSTSDGWASIIVCIAQSPPATLKEYDNIARLSVKTKNGVSLANMKTHNGLTWNIG